MVSTNEVMEVYAVLLQMYQPIWKYGLDDKTCGIETQTPDTSPDDIQRALESSLHNFRRFWYYYSAYISKSVTGLLWKWV